MAKQSVTIFSWGYDGWGNWTDRLVEDVDAVEASRGRGPPLFVDIRASRKVRAEGFREHAFERRFGPERYLWLNGLGNAAILTGARHGEFVDPSAAGTLLDLALELRARKRRIIFFCSCVSPTDGCHRHWVAPELFALAKKAGEAVTVVEWPGFENDSMRPSSLKLSAPVFASLYKKLPKSLPLGKAMPEVGRLALPWWSPVRLESGDRHDWILSGPAQHRAGGWQLPILSAASRPKEGIRLIKRARKELCLLPRSYPANRVSQVPVEW